MILSKTAARRRKLAVLTLSVSVLALPQALGFERVVVGTRHFVECLGLMVSEPDLHEQECLPNRVPNALSLDGSGGGSALKFAAPAVVPPVVVPPVVVPPVVVPPVVVPPVVVPPIVVPPPPPPPPPPVCVCGPCYPT